MASIYDMVAAFQQLGLQIRAVGDEAVQQAERVKAAETKAGMTSESKGGVMGSTTTDLGEPRDATEQAARMIASIRNATGR